MIELRVVTAEMLLELSELHVRSWQAAYRGIVPDAYLDAMSVEQRLQRWQQRFPSHDEEQYAVLAGGRIVGLCMLCPSREAGDRAGEVQAFYLHPDEWGRGYAHPAMRLALARLWELGHQEAMLWTFELNQRARRFYERAGFQPDGGRQPLHIGGEEQWEIRYRRTLP